MFDSINSSCNLFMITHGEVEDAFVISAIGATLTEEHHNVVFFLRF